jgi:hypothetical protein
MESDLRSGPGSARYARTPEALKHVRQPIQNLTNTTAEANAETLRSAGRKIYKEL